MINTYATDGIIIKRRELGESDKLLTVLTPHQGKITVLAKGIRKIRSRRAAHLELFNRVLLTIRYGKSLDLVTEAEVKESYGTIRNDLTRVAYAYRMVEEIDRLCPEKQAHPEIFSLLVDTLQHLNQPGAYTWEALTDEFTLRVLRDLGYLTGQQQLPRVQLRQYIESITERSMHSDRLLDKLRSEE